MNAVSADGCAVDREAVGPIQSVLGRAGVDSKFSLIPIRMRMRI